eukprot:TRINITY_DN16634_c0_g1_i3.p1 TRINITY_DN16634_c0_g1~~TRINITY_DN16634_c0_g1_i3.p1  ORF type:complete len:492 (-),score=64.53 TRINITY_DN16634_c0_g1_i3:34-1509(-)
MTIGAAMPLRDDMSCRAMLGCMAAGQFFVACMFLFCGPLRIRALNLLSCISALLVSILVALSAAAIDPTVSQETWVETVVMAVSIIQFLTSGLRILVALHPAAFFEPILTNAYLRLDWKYDAPYTDWRQRIHNRYANAAHAVKNSVFNVRRAITAKKQSMRHRNNQRPSGKNYNVEDGANRGGMIDPHTLDEQFDELDNALLGAHDVEMDDMPSPEQEWENRCYAAQYAALPALEAAFNEEGSHVEAHLERDRVREDRERKRSQAPIPMPQIEFDEPFTGASNAPPSAGSSTSTFDEALLEELLSKSEYRSERLFDVDDVDNDDEDESWAETGNNYNDQVMAIYGEMHADLDLPFGEVDVGMKPIRRATVQSPTRQPSAIHKKVGVPEVSVPPLSDPPLSPRPIPGAASSVASEMTTFQARSPAFSPFMMDGIPICQSVVFDSPTPASTPQVTLSLIHISEPTRLLSISYAVFCLKKKKTNTKEQIYTMRY